MTIFFIITIAILLIADIYFIVKRIKVKTYNEEIDQKNKEAIDEYIKLQEDLALYRKQIQENKNEQEESLIQLEEQKGSYNKLVQQLNEKKQEIKDLEAKQLAYFQEQKRQEEIRRQEDYYRLIISDDDKIDIELLREAQKRIIKKEAIDKIIYESYYRPAYNTLMSHLFDTDNKISGIYRLTDRKTGLSYIGQSLDIKERFRTHIKTGLSSDSTVSKLYLQMKKSGIDNFIFEIIEKTPKDKLNEREKYWIDFYKTVSHGLNSKAGGA